MAIFGVGPNRCPETKKLKLAYLCQKKELAALLWRIFVSHAYLQAYATRRQNSGIKKKIFIDPKQTVFKKQGYETQKDAMRNSLTYQLLGGYKEDGRWQASPGVGEPKLNPFTDPRG